MLNVIVSEGAWRRFRTTAKTSPALLIRGTLQSASGVLNLVAEHLHPLPISTSPASRDFR